MVTSGTQQTFAVIGGAGGGGSIRATTGAGGRAVEDQQAQVVLDKVLILTWRRSVRIQEWKLPFVNKLFFFSGDIPSFLLVCSLSHIGHFGNQPSEPFMLTRLP